jgi:hypothetical protein
MTQAFNLSQFANNLNTSGATSNAGLQNSAVTVTAGTGMSGGGSVALGSSVTLTNAGVTSVTAGSGISVSASTGGVTISSTGGAGTVTSVATGNGLTGGTITGSGTLSITAPSYQSVGSHLAVVIAGSFNPNSNYAGSNLNVYSFVAGCGSQFAGAPSGTYRCLGGTQGGNSVFLAVRVS